MAAVPTEACCAAIGAEVLAAADAAELAVAFRALADPVRLQLLSLIANAGEACACDLSTPVSRSQPTISHHLALLTDVGLVRREKRGKWAYYRVVPERLQALRGVLATGIGVA